MAEGGEAAKTDVELKKKQLQEAMFYWVGMLCEASCTKHLSPQSDEITFLIIQQKQN